MQRLLDGTVYTPTFLGEIVRKKFFPIKINSLVVVTRGARWRDQSWDKWLKIMRVFCWGGAVGRIRAECSDNILCFLCGAKWWDQS